MTIDEMISQKCAPCGARMLLALWLPSSRQIELQFACACSPVMLPCKVLREDLQGTVEKEH